MSKHTPGPWAVCDYAANPSCGVQASDEGPIADTGFRPISESQANARLIAAAPELKTLAENLEITGPDTDGLVWLILRSEATTNTAMFNLGEINQFAAQVALEVEQSRRAAIAKATGEA